MNNKFQADEKCPICRKWCRWRSGYEFEHMKRCYECEIVWEPEMFYSFGDFVKKISFEAETWTK
jgi:hypothetical protein